MKAKIVRRLTGEVLATLEGALIEDIYETSSFFSVPSEFALSEWDKLWSAVQGGEVRYIKPASNGGYRLQVLNDSIDWEE